MLSWVLCACLAVTAAALLVKLLLLRRGLNEIRDGFLEKLTADTNTLIAVSSRDARLRHLAANLNAQLRLLRRQRLQYENGDRELKEAVANISHDLRTPLTAIMGYLELLADGGPDAARYIALITERAEAMKHLTEELFQYSVILSEGGQLKEESVSLNAALEESLAAFHPVLTRRGIIPRVSMPETVVTRALDKAALARVLGHLLDNAAKYSDGDLDVTLTADGAFTFANTAGALDEVRVQQIFRRYFTVQTARSATGLGLSIARALTERMGGTADARYAQGRLNVRVCFPSENLPRLRQ